MMKVLTTPNILFAALSAVFFAFAFRPLPPPTDRTEEVLHYVPTSTDRTNLSLRAEEYRQQLAVKLNRQRVDTEYEATFASRAEAPGQSATAHEDDLALGVEAIRKHSSRDVPVNANQPEAQIRNQLLQQRALAQQNAAARKQFIAQYVANARAEGYDVIVDDDYNVQVVHAPNDGRGPQSVDDERPQSGFITAGFVYAPFCR